MQAGAFSSTVIYSGCMGGREGKTSIRRALGKEAVEYYECHEDALCKAMFCWPAVRVFFLFFSSPRRKLAIRTISKDFGGIHADLL